jgi:uncharacterized tellurite resistance protein B-like protein
MGILDVFRSIQTGPSEERASADTETVRKIADELDRLDAAKARYIAAFAYILGRVAHADLDISEQETRNMERIVMRWGEIPEEQAILVVRMAKTQNLLFGGTENFLVTREFNSIAGREQKICLLHCLFEVSASDESISAAEDRTIRQIADELKIGHGEFIRIRSAHKKHLDVLKKDAGQSG